MTNSSGYRAFWQRSRDEFAPKYEIYIRSFPDPGERTVVSEGGGNVPFLSSDGNTLYYARGDQLNVPNTAEPPAGCISTSRWIVVQTVGTAGPKVVLRSWSDSSWSPTSSRS